jgi:hypothetical protein
VRKVRASQEKRYFYVQRPIDARGPLALVLPSRIDEDALIRERLAEDRRTHEVGEAATAYMGLDQDEPL